MFDIFLEKLKKILNNRTVPLHFSCGVFCPDSAILSDADRFPGSADL